MCPCFRFRARVQASSGGNISAGCEHSNVGLRQLPKRVEFGVQVSYRDCSPKFEVLVWGASNRHQNAIGNYSGPYSAACEGFHGAGLLAVPWTPSRWSLHQKQ